MTRILGISAYYHDSAACLLKDGRIEAAIQEERFSREKHDSSFPRRAIQACLEIDGCAIEDVDYVVFYEKPFEKFERLLETYLAHCPRGFQSYLKAIPVWVKEKLWIKETLSRELDFDGPILFADHHESHAASAFYPSPFKSAAILSVDGVGEWATTTLGRGEGDEIELTHEIRFPHSLGLLYSAFTYHLGFRVNSGEYKMMGLAPYGKPRYLDLILDHLIEADSDGAFRLNLEYFDYEVGLAMTSSRFEELFQEPPRQEKQPLTQKHKDLAASIQIALEQILLKVSIQLKKLTGETRMCMAGGVALNCVANGRLLREGPFEDLWIQPAAGDAGGCLGAALAVWHRYLKQSRLPQQDFQQGSQLGACYETAPIRAFLTEMGARFFEQEDEALFPLIARYLEQGAVVGWFQGRMEFGPRALGNRSILADPRRSDMLDEVNLRIKFRESFRPFAPAVLEEAVSHYFELETPSPYMLLVASVQPSKRGTIPAVTHVDGSARIQTVNRTQNPRFYRLIETFEQQTGCAVLLNTSFNVRGEPIVESPRQAYECFMRTRMDVLVLENCVLVKTDQPTGLE